MEQLSQKFFSQLLWFKNYSGNENFLVYFIYKNKIIKFTAPDKTVYNIQRKSKLSLLFFISASNDRRWVWIDSVHFIRPVGISALLPANFFCRLFSLLSLARRTHIAGTALQPCATASSRVYRNHGEQQLVLRALPLRDRKRKRSVLAARWTRCELFGVVVFI